ncbi:Carboxylesterase, type B [Cordyceps fumosorosea ARSEF 2679]|uniref:Carboxylesterase, type B n=1 Tax=Cordyceps fumosorosea (strain ARSEF 2679) TaxID=1081104 RepID=A0A162I6C5_CORFA|nr:Carboxylesterase, type B [Cordyceps fumosorosea ARSEF 2679]OAA52875.1 Carboxylesterase, type B [Cordyceps fumosorosea ARSEF 2679]
MPAENLTDAFGNTTLLIGNDSAKTLVLFNIGRPNMPDVGAASIDNDLIKEQPLHLGSQVPLISGCKMKDANDSNLFVFLYYYLHTTPDAIPSEENYNKFIVARGPGADLLNRTYPLGAFVSALNGSVAEAVVAGVSRMVTAASYKCPSYKVHRAAHAARTRSYAYQFDHQPSCPWLFGDGVGPVPAAGAAADIYGAAHCAELPFVFGTMDRRPFGEGNCSASAAERALSEVMGAA